MSDWFEDQWPSVLIALAIVLLVLSGSQDDGGSPCPDGTHEVTVEVDSQNGTTKVCGEG